MLRKEVWAMIALFVLGISSSPSQAAKISMPYGDYVMEAVDRQNVTDNILRDYRISGLHVRSRWSDGNFTFLTQQIQRVAAAGKHYTLGVYAGTASNPSWVSDSKPWLYTAQWTQYVASLGQKFGNDPNLDAVHMAAPVTADSMEMYLPSNLASHTNQDIITSWERSIDAYGSAFPTKTLVLDLAMVPDSKGAITKAVDEYARATLGARFEAIVCNLKASTSKAAPHILELERLRSEGVRIGFEMIGPSSDTSRFGGSFVQGLNLGKSLGGEWFQIYQSDVQYLPKLQVGRATPEPNLNLWLLAVFMIVLPRTRRRDSK
jgi:hypothetical protein